MSFELQREGVSRRKRREIWKPHLSNNNDIRPFGDFLLEWRVLEQRNGSKVGRSDVGVETERLSKLEETLLGSNGSDSPLGSSHGS